ncbi:MAG: hypothetical protein LBH85_09715 [Treponema sp.]|nr:hypothetical protein [Treponema sp.]
MNTGRGVYMFAEPLAGWRRVEAPPRRAKRDCARQIEWPLDARNPEASKVIVVMDNLNTHTFSSLYESFPLNFSI